MLNHYAAAIAVGSTSWNRSVVFVEKDHEEQMGGLRRTIQGIQRDVGYLTRLADVRVVKSSATWKRGCRCV